MIIIYCWSILFLCYEYKSTWFSFNAYKMDIVMVKKEIKFILSNILPY